MKKIMIPTFLILLFMLSACKNQRSVTISSDNNYIPNESEIQNSIPQEGNMPAVTPTTKTKADELDNSQSTNDTDRTEKENGEPVTNEEKDETGKYIGPLVPGVTTDMQKPGFWIKQYDNLDAIIMTIEEIGRYNDENYKNLPYLMDFNILPEILKGQDLLQWINEFSIVPKSTRYDEEGHIYQQQDYTDLKKNINTDKIVEIIKAEYGVTIRRTQMRTWPTYKQSYSSPTNQRIDYFTETAVYAAEPVLIYHISNDGLWYFAQIYNYKGWIPVRDVALCSGEVLMNYCSSENLLVVNTAVMHTPYSTDSRTSQMQLDMGVTLPILSENSGGYVVNYPILNENNYLEFAQVKIPFSEKISRGFLDYTGENVIKQAFKFLGEPYGWGGMNNVRDCSSFIADVYRSFGIILPRNSNQQEKMSGSVSFSGKSRSERLEILNDLRPGSALYMPGHAMMYLGKWRERHYIIHDVTTVYQKGNDGKLIPIPLNQVSVTPLHICNSKGTEYIMLLTTAVVFE